MKSKLFVLINLFFYSTAHAGYIYDSKKYKSLDQAKERVEVERSSQDQLSVKKMCRDRSDQTFSLCSKSKSYDIDFLVLISALETLDHLSIFGDKSSVDLSSLKKIDTNNEPKALEALSFGIPVVGSVVSLPSGVGVLYGFLWLKEAFAQRSNLRSGSAGIILSAYNSGNPVQISNFDGTDAVKSVLENLDVLIKDYKEVIDGLKNDHQDFSDLTSLDDLIFNLQTRIFDLTILKIENDRIKESEPYRSIVQGSFLKNLLMFYNQKLDRIEIKSESFSQGKISYEDLQKEMNEAYFWLSIYKP
ncbi:MAG: hypothetical protein KDD50_05580 [Bdellovibrionales bacterium]|nr:hypothetical protein [Bdellovibrionales bacterium]